MNDWSTLTLRQAGVELIDCVHKTPAALSEGFPYVAIPDMKSGRIDFSSARRISQSDFVDWTRKARPRRDDVILSRRTNPGVTAVDDTGTEFALGQNLVLLRSDGKAVHPPFLRWLCRGPEWWGQIEKFLNVGAVFSSLRCGDVPKFELTIPPLPEQREIASILGALDDKIELNRRMSATLEEMVRALYQSWFVNFDPVKAKSEGSTPAFMDEVTAALFPDRFGDDGLPEGWRMLSFVETIDIISGGTPKTSEPTYWGGMIPWYSVVDAPGTGQIFVSETEKMITESGLRNSPSRLVPRGTTIISARGTVGKLAMTARPMTFNQSCYGLRSRHVRGDAFCYFATERAVGELQSRSHGSVFSTITRQTFEGIDVIDCSDAVQVAFADRVDPYMARICSIVEENRTLAALRDTLLPKLMSGELRVGEAREQAETAA